MNEQIAFYDFLLNDLRKAAGRSTIIKFLNYKQSEVVEQDITIQLLERFEKYLLEKDMGSNTRRLYLTEWIASLRRCEVFGYSFPVVLDTVKTVIKNPEEACESVYLNRDEVELIENYVPKTDAERFSKAFFLIGCYTGARTSDIITMSNNNIRKGEINFVDKKTKKSNKVPCHPRVPELLEIIKGHSYSENSIRTTVGSTIKRICMLVGIDEMTTLYRRGKQTTAKKYNFISCHSSRKSFVTNCYLNGFKMQQISKFCGHKSSSITEEKYLCITFDDDRTGNRDFFGEVQDKSFNQIRQMIDSGLTETKALEMMTICGSSTTEIQRLRTKLNQTA